MPRGIVDVSGMGFSSRCNGLYGLNVRGMLGDVQFGHHGCRGGSEYLRRHEGAAA